MDPSAALLHEEVVSFVVDLPGGSHAQVVAPALPRSLLGEALAAAADDADEVLVLHGAGWPRRRSPPGAPRPRAARSKPSPRSRTAWGPLVADLAIEVRAGGKAGVLVAIDAAASIAALGSAGHALAEASLGPVLPPGVRVVCFYPEETRPARAPPGVAVHPFTLRAGGP